MSWKDFYQRQHAMRSVLQYAFDHPEAPLETVPEPFADVDELLAALRYKWTQALTGRVDSRLDTADDDESVDRVQGVTAAWRATASAHPELNALVNRRVTSPGPQLDAALAREDRLLALASGLADRTEPDEIVRRIGAAFRRLLRSAPVGRQPETNELYRLIATSGPAGGDPFHAS